MSRAFPMRRITVNLAPPDIYPVEADASFLRSVLPEQAVPYRTVVTLVRATGVVDSR